MPSVVILPYKNIEHSIDISIDVSMAPDVVDDFPVVRASSFDEPTAFKVVFECRLSDSALSKLDKAGQPVVQLREVSVTSRRRRIHVPAIVERDGDDHVLRFEVEIDRSAARGSIDFTPIVVRTTGAVTSTESAGQLLGWGETVKVIIDEQPPPPGNGLPIIWLSFSDRGLPVDNIFHLDAHGDIPTILLNSDVDGLKDVLHNTGATGRKARIRDAVYAQIALQVWTCLLVECLAEVQELRAENPEHTLEDHVEAVAPWKQGVIYEWFPQLLGLRSLDDQLDDDNFAGAVTDRMASLIQQKLRTPKLGFDGLYREFGLSAAEER